MKQGFQITLQETSPYPTKREEGKSSSSKVPAGWDVSSPGRVVKWYIRIFVLNKPYFMGCELFTVCFVSNGQEFLLLLIAVAGWIQSFLENYSLWVVMWRCAFLLLCLHGPVGHGRERPAPAETHLGSQQGGPTGWPTREFSPFKEAL